MVAADSQEVKVAAVMARDARCAHAGGGAVRWVRTAVIALCAALALLVHHEISAATVSSMSSHALRGMSGAATGSAHAPSDVAARSAHGQAVHPAAYDMGDTACSGSGMAHCSTASVDTVKLAPPPASFAGRDRRPYETAIAGSEATGTVPRAPPDLAVLSQLRI